MSRKEISDITVPTKIAWPHAATWQDHSAPYACGYRKTSEGLVICEGLALTTAAKAVASDFVIATLPVGYRPVQNLYFTEFAFGVVINSYGPYTVAPVANTGNAILYVATDGAVHLYGTGLAISGYVSLAQIQFIAI